MTLLKPADDELKVKCFVTYATSTSPNVFGGELPDSDVTLRIGQITSFTASNTDLIADEVVTLTCTANAGTAPTFHFVTREGDNTLDDSLFTEKVRGSVTQSGDAFSQEITLKSLVARTGQTVYCKVYQSINIILSTIIYLNDKSLYLFKDKSLYLFKDKSLYLFKDKSLYVLALRRSKVVPKKLINLKFLSRNVFIIL